MVFTDITRRGALSEEAKITAIKVALKKIHKREDKIWVINIDSQSSIQSIECNKKNHSISNQIYDILAELQAPAYIVPAYIGIKRNKKAAKQAIDRSGIITTRLLYTDYYMTIRRARNSKWPNEWENSNSKLHYIKLCFVEWEST